MSQDDLAEYRGLYIQTAKSYVAQMKQHLLVLIAYEQDAVYQDALKSTYIAAHSLKGQSMVMGYTKTAILSNLIENIFHGFIHKTVQVSSPVLKSINESVSELEQSILQVEQFGSEKDLSAAIQKLENMSGVVPSIPKEGTQ